MSGAGVDGIGLYTKELLHSLGADSGLQSEPFTFGSFDPMPNSPVMHQLPRFSLGSLPSLMLGTSYFGSGKLQRKIDVIHATDHLIPRCNTVPVVATIMDAIPLAHPEWVNTGFGALKNTIWKKSVSFADQVITISNHSKSDLIEYFGIPENKITVTPLAVDERWFEKSTLEQLNTIRCRYMLPENFFLFVGTLQPRKNLIRIIEAHCLLPESVRKSHPLLIIGRAGWQSEETLNRLLSGHPNLRWLKYVPEADLPGILRCASGLVFPSLHEGFGLPVLEAFAAELPVITSNITSLPEVAGNAALLVDPYDIENISWAMQQLIDDTAMTHHLRQIGLHRAREFTWDKTAQATISVYRKAIANF
jgi:alpha-1,3-rhamnosyl/mannosyltransferase